MTKGKSSIVLNGTIKLRFMGGRTSAVAGEEIIVIFYFSAFQHEAGMITAAYRKLIYTSENLRRS